MDTVHRVVVGDSRSMSRIDDCSVHLMVTSPPYPMIEMWDELFTVLNSKVGGALECGDGSMAYDLMHQELAKVWEETYRVLVDGGLACVNVGDATRKIDGRFRLYPNHSRIMEVCEEIGFNTLPYILWKKPTNKPNAFLGSGFLPTSPYVTLDCEYILIFRKGEPRKFEPKDPVRYDSKFTKKERDVWCSQVWDVKGARQTRDELSRRTAEYPEEIVRRLIRMHTIRGDTVLDPFLGTGTTTKVAAEVDRNSIGYEQEEKLIPVIKEKTGVNRVEYVT